MRRLCAAGLGALIGTAMSFYILFGQGLKTRDQLTGVEQKVEQILRSMPIDMDDPNLVPQNISHNQYGSNPIYPANSNN